MLCWEVCLKGQLAAAAGGCELSCLADYGAALHITEQCVDR